MAAVYRDIQISWGGEEYSIKPTMALLNQIEQKFSLSRVASRMMDGDTPTSHLAVIVGIMLRSAGAKVTDDEVFAELMTGDASSVTEMGTALLTAAFPMQVDEGNAPAPAKAKKQASRKK